MLVRLMLLCFAGLLLWQAGCSEPAIQTPDASPATNVSKTQVEHFGPMRKVMREGLTQARIRLADAVSIPHAYAVGALEELQGEVTILDGQVWVSRVGDDGSLSVTGPSSTSDDAATLLTLAHVTDWEAMEINSVAAGRELETLIRDFAESKGLDTSKPFPFRMEGKPRQIEIHVINGYCPIATDPAGQEKQPWRNTDQHKLNVRVVGFYASDSVAVMTHHGTAIHAHAIGVMGDQTVMGHIDSLTVEPGMTLLVPKLN